MSDHLGMGVLLGMLFDMDNKDAQDRLRAMLGQKITRFELHDDVLIIDAGEGIEDPITIFDAGQSCCESRYMRTDDDLKDFIGATLKDIECVDGGRVGENDDEYAEEHEINILKVITDQGTATFTNHVEHNGYYGGFNIVVDRISEADARYRGPFKS